MDDTDPEQVTQDEVREEADRHEDDPVTSREALENELMDEGESEAGEGLGESTP